MPVPVGAGGGAIAFWLAEQVGPGGTVVATDLETEFLEAEAARHPGFEVLRHDITVEDLPSGFDLVHTRWLIEWLPDKLLDDLIAVGLVDAEVVAALEDRRSPWSCP